MLTGLTRLGADALEGFRGVYHRPDGSVLPFALCLEAPERRITRDRLKSSALELATEPAPVTFEFKASMSEALLSELLHQTMTDHKHSSVILLCEDKATFAKLSEVMGMGRRELVRLAGQNALYPDETTKQPIGSFHKLAQQLVADKVIKPVGEDDAPLWQLQQDDAVRWAAASLENGLKYGRKYVLTGLEEFGLRHFDAPQGRYYMPDDLTVIEARVKHTTSEGRFEANYVYVQTPRQDDQDERAFNFLIFVRETPQKPYEVIPIQIEFIPNEAYNGGALQGIRFNGTTYDKSLDALSTLFFHALEQINSPVTRHIARTPDNAFNATGATNHSLADSFARAGKKDRSPYFAATEVATPSSAQNLTPLHDTERPQFAGRSAPGLHPVKPHWQTYHTKDGAVARYKELFYRGDASKGASLNPKVFGDSQ